MNDARIELTQDATEEDAARRIEGWIVAWARTTLKLGEDCVGAETALLELGLDSVDAIYMLSDLEAMLDVKLDANLLLDCPTPRALAPHVARAWATRPAAAHRAASTAA